MLTGSRNQIALVSFLTSTFRDIPRREQFTYAWALIIFQTASGLTGISRCRMPKGDNASTIAFTIAGVAPIVPASPTPFTPSGLTGDGVSVRSSSSHGIIAAFGSA